MNTRIRNIFHLGLKEFSSLKRDTALVFLVVFVFTVGIYITAKGLSTGIQNAAIAIVDEDDSALSRSIAAGFYPPYFQRPNRIDISQAKTVVDSGRYTFVLVIPEGFAADILSNKRPSLLVDIDATVITQAGIGAGYIQTIIYDAIGVFLDTQALKNKPTIEQIIRMKFNPNLEESWFAALMQIINYVTMLGIILAGGALIREREHGTIDHLLVMPITPSEIVLAKIWSNALVILIATTLCTYIVVQQWLSVPIAGSVPLFLLGTAFYLFSTTSMGIFMGTFARSMPQLGLLFILIVLPMNLLSGGVTPRESMPELIQIVMQFVPSTHYVDFAQAILYRGGGFETVWFSFASILVIGGVYFFAALFFFRKMVVKIGH